MKYSLKQLEDKLVHDLDYRFLDSIKNKFPTNNAYFLVCLAESIYNSEDYESEDILDKVIEEAYKLYNDSDISSYLRDVQNETC